ncbi:hypothetical protein FQN55_003990 [Onygenales sp. PD_40]|nr:hypothetical protein FQN55_003990 [Onygenales sp. PD_40]KAK2786999.1 hypothetical protein FQN52_007441 [Onygenales sp. PD_12]
MATPPPDTSIVDDKPLPPAVEEVPLDANVNSILEPKTVAVKLPETMSEPRVTQPAAHENQPLSPAVNGNGVDQPLSNGVNGGADTGDASHSQPPKSPSTQETSPSTEPPAPTATATQTSADMSQPEPVASVEKPEAPATENQDVNQPATLAPDTQPPKAQTTPSSPNLQPEPTSIETTIPAVSASEPPPTIPTTQPQTSLPAPETQEPPAPTEAPVLPTAPSQPPPVVTNLSQQSPLSPQTTPTVMTPVAPEPSQAALVAQTQGDQEMVDAPPASPSKISREREEDVNEEPAAKRARTEDSAPAAPEFKVPDLPPPSSQAPDSQPGPPITKLQSKHIAKIFQNLKRAHDSRFFREPVDPVKLGIPSYPTIVTNPMDLRTMEEKFKSGSYKSVDAIASDFNLMINNCITFNGPDHAVSIEGRNLKDNFQRQIARLPSADEAEATPAEKKAKKLSTAPTKTQPPRRESRVVGTTPARPTNAASPTTTFALGPEGLPLIRRDSSTTDGRPKRSIHPPKNRELPYSAKPKKKKFQWELKFCQEVLDELYKPKHYPIAHPFYNPVDPVALNIPTYHSIIKKPMDLHTVQTKLQTGQYENAKEMEIDIHQIFKNCYKFNIPGDPTYTAGKALEDIFENKWAQKARWIEAHEPSSGHQSAGTSDNGSDDEVEDSDDDNEQEKLSLLQKQIAEMSKQVEAITQKKKKTPPGSSKKSNKSKSGKKDPKKGSGLTGASGRKDKKGKSGKSEKQHWVTYREKQIISHGISSLPEHRMTEALKIIQTNVPSLRDTKEAEIELDIDELPNEVLLVLLRFVKKHAPASFNIDEPEPEPAPVVAPSKPKKNKPMSKYEQEAQINRLASNISRFQGGHSQEPMPSIEAEESSEDEDDSEESEEE